MKQKVIEIIEQQQAGYEGEPLWMVGEQLKEIAEREPASAELLAQDLTVEGLDLAGAAGALQQYADKHHGKARRFCITPKVAEQILREFYGLPDPGEATEVMPEATFLDLTSFL